MIPKNQNTKFELTKADDTLNKFKKLPELITSHIVSFLDNKSRLRASLANYSLFKASNESISKYHFEINKSFIDNKLCLRGNGFDINNCFKNIYSFSCSEISRIGTIGKRKQSVCLSHLSALLTSSATTLKKLDIGYYHPFNNIFIDSNIKIESMSFNNAPYSAEILWNQATNLKSVQLFLCYDISYLKDIQFLWIKRTNLYNNSSIIDLSNGDIAVNKYIITCSNLEHLELRGISRSIICDQTSTPHPLFWLWNLSNLKSCQLMVNLPNHQLFEQECDKLLSSSIIVNKAQKQSKFNTLSLDINCWYRTSQQNNDESLGKDLNVFLKYLRKIYVNLTCIQYEINMRRWENNRLSLYSCNLDWNYIFNGIVEIKIDIFSIKIAVDFLTYLQNHQYIKVCHLTQISAKTTSYGIYNYYDSMERFIDNICNFIGHRPNALHSFNIDMIYQSKNSYRNLEKDYFGAYAKYLNYLLNRIQSHNDIFDGYLKLKLPELKHIYKTTKFPNGRFGEKYHLWDKDNIKCSFKISQIICKIQTAINQYNNNNSHNAKTTILDLDRLKLFSKHNKFLQFWFNNDQNLYENNKFVMY